MLTTREYMSRLYHADLERHMREILAEHPLLSDPALTNEIHKRNVPCDWRLVAQVRRAAGIPNFWKRLRAHKQAAEDMVNRQPLEFN